MVKHGASAPPARTPLILGVLSLTLLWQSSVRAEYNLALAEALQTVLAADLKRHVEVLADDTFEGRDTGSRGGRAASVYLLNFLKQHELKAAGSEGYFQSFHSGGRNVLGMLEGTDPQLKREVVVICGHYDHVGYGTPSNSYGPLGYIHNGADDNASGVAALLEIIEALAQPHRRPRRSILFAFWDGEEKGLLGSKHWTRSPTIDFERIVFAFNVDMIGRLKDDHVEVYGARSAKGMRQMTSRHNHGDLKLQFAWEMKANSDHHSFFERDVPVMMLHTGLHSDYHRPSDDAHLLNYDGMQKITRLLTELAMDVAMADARPSFRPESRTENDDTRKRIESPASPAPARLALSYRQGESGAEVTAIDSAGPAAAAGLRVGDRLLEIGGQKIDAQTPLQTAVLRAPPETTALIQRDGDAAPRTVQLQLQGPPVRLGLSWREDPAEPGIFTVVRVQPGSPAHASGIELGDRLYEVNGQPLPESRELGALIRDIAPGPVRCLIERDGRLRTVVVQL